MKTKTIRAILSRVFKDWVDSIEDDEVCKLVEANTIITGGSIASMLLGEKVNDYDVYFTNRETVVAAAKYYVDEFKKNPPQKSKYRPVFLSSNAITLSNKIQLTIRFYGAPDEIHKNYDFVHCTNYWVAKTGELVVTKEALEVLITRELRYQGSLYPLCSIIRTRKFLKRDWTINAGQYLKMCLQVAQLDLTDPRVLEDQLVGVDVAYFAELLRAVNEKSPEKLEAAYIVEIIDRMF